MSDPELPGFSPAPVSVPEDPQPSVWGGIRRLFSSSKYVLVLLAVVGVVIMNLAGRISGEAALAAIGTLVSVAVGATALEDAAEKKGGRPMSPGATSALMTGFQNIMALVPAVLQARSSQGVAPLEVPAAFFEKALPYLRERGYQLTPGASLCRIVNTLNEEELRLETDPETNGLQGVRELLGEDLIGVYVKMLADCGGAEPLERAAPQTMDS